MSRSRYRFHRFADGPYSLMAMRVACTVAIWSSQGVSAQMVTSLALGSLPAPPGGQVYVPLVLSHSGEAQICTIVSEITYTSGLLSFDGVTKGPSADSAGAEVDADVRPGEGDPANSLLKVTVACSQAQGVPDGIVAYLGFKVSDQAPFGEIALRHTATVQTGKEQSGRLQPVEVRSGTIDVKVSDNPFHACFFYMH